MIYSLLVAKHKAVATRLSYSQLTSSRAKLTLDVQAVKGLSDFWRGLSSAQYFTKLFCAVSRQFDIYIYIYIYIHMYFCLYLFMCFQFFLFLFVFIYFQIFYSVFVYFYFFKKINLYHFISFYFLVQTYPTRQATTNWTGIEWRTQKASIQNGGAHWNGERTSHFTKRIHRLQNEAGWEVSIIKTWPAYKMTVMHWPWGPNFPEALHTGMFYHFFNLLPPLLSGCRGETGVGSAPFVAVGRWGRSSGRGRRRPHRKDAQNRYN